MPFIDQKASTAIRAELLSLLGLPSLYALDRLDMTSATSIDLAAQQRLTAELQQLTDPDAARDLGLYGHRLLDADRSGEPLIASLTLYERGDGVNYLRVQTDNLNQPFDLNSGAKLDLGSTAKLRTLITYLEVVAALHDRLTRLDPAEREALAAAAADPLTQWAIEYVGAGQVDLTAMLEAAMARRYSASPWERFFTGGGVHQFTNFNADDNGRVMSVAEAFRHSVNLVFIRMMRDIVQYYRAAGAPADAILGDRQHPLRQTYLARFADREGTTFLNRFYDGFVGLSPDQVLDRLAGQVRPRAARLAVVFRSLRPDADLAAFDAFLRARLAEPPSERELVRLYDGHGPDRLNLNDRAYVAGLHPLELWLATYWQDDPGITRSAMLEAAARGASGELCLAVQDRQQGQAGQAHPHPARGGGVRADPRGVAAPRLSVRSPGAVLRHGDRQLGRPAGGARRAGRHPAQRRRLAAGRPGREAAFRRQHALRDRPRRSTPAGGRRDRPRDRARGARGDGRRGRDGHGARGCAAPSATTTACRSRSAPRPAPAITAASRSARAAG